LPRELVEPPQRFLVAVLACLPTLRFDLPQCAPNIGSTGLNSSAIELCGLGKFARKRYHRGSPVLRADLARADSWVASLPVRDGGLATAAL
jgi:hypothetical protein